MASRLSALRLSTFLTSGDLRVTKMDMSVHVIPPAITRLTKVDMMVHAAPPTIARNSMVVMNVHSAPPTKALVSQIEIDGWFSLDQGLYLNGPIFGSNEVFTPDFSTLVEYDSPEPPTVEVNPYRADVPNIDQQRIMRDQHNLIQAGDTTFHWGVLSDIYAEPIYTLGSLGRFYHDDYGLIQARFCKFVDFVQTPMKAVPVGWHTSRRELWTVTNQFPLSNPNFAVGVAVTYNENLYDGNDWYGWVIVDGLVPAEMGVQIDSTPFMFGTEYGWVATGEVKPDRNSVGLGYRFVTNNLPILPPGGFKVELRNLSLARLKGIITAQVAPLQSQVDQLVTDSNALSATVAGHTQQITTLGQRINTLDARLTREVKSMADSLAAIRALMPDGGYVAYTDAKFNAMKNYVDTNLTVVSTVANQGLTRANEAMAYAQSISNAAVQVQIDSLNDALGNLTGRLMDFSVRIVDIANPSPLAEGDTLVATFDFTDANGIDHYVFIPQQNSLANLVDVDITTTPPADGQSLIWDAGDNLWIPGDPVGGGGIPDAPSDGTLYGRKDGAWEAVPGGGGSSTPWWFDPPLASIFSLATGGGSNATLTDDADVGLLIDPVNLDGTLKFMYKTLTNKTLNWSCIARLTGFMFNQNYASYGIYLRDSISGRGLINAMTNNVGIIASKFNSLSSYNSDYITSGVSPGPPGAIWFRVDRVSSNLLWMISSDGKNWVTFTTQAVTNFLWNPPDQVGIYVASNALGLRVSCANFSLTGPAV